MAKAPASSKTPSAQKTRFEDALKRLEGVVEQLEDGEIALEEALKLFEEGVRLSRVCAKKLDEAEKKIEILSRDEDGKVRTRPFGDDGEDPG
jgi:exodeoxyribonuclease VII small subunit